MDGPIRVLHVDDDPDFGDLVALALEREDERFTVERETGPEAALDRLGSEQFECIVSDYDMPGTDGIAFLEAVREGYPDLPFVLFTGKGSEEVASDAISAGVTDYLQKGVGSDKFPLLANRVVNAVESYRTRRTLEEHREYTDDILNAVEDVFYVRGKDGDIRRYNDQLLEVTGYTPEELAGTDSVDLIAEEDQDRVERAIETVFETGSGRVEANYETTDGETIPYEFRAVALENPGGDAVYAGIGRDVTERKRREERLQFYERLIEKTSDIVTVVETDGTVRYQSPATEDVLGYDQEALVGDDVFERVHPDDLAELREPIRELADSPGSATRRTQYRLENAAGEWQWLESVTANLTHTELDGYVVSTRPIGERKERERELARQNDLFETVQEIVGVGAWQYDVRSEELWLTEVATEIFGLPTGDESSTDDLRCVDPDDRPAVRDALESAIECGEPTEIECRLQKGDTGQTRVRIRAEPEDEDGEVVRLGGTVEDADAS